MLRVARPLRPPPQAVAPPPACLPAGTHLRPPSKSATSCSLLHCALARQGQGQGRGQGRVRGRPTKRNKWTRVHRWPCERHAPVHGVYQCTAACEAFAADRPPVRDRTQPARAASGGGGTDSRGELAWLLGAAVLLRLRLLLRLRRLEPSAVRQPRCAAVRCHHGGITADEHACRAPYAGGPGTLFSAVH